MSIRRANISDAKGIAELLVAAWQSAYRGLLPDAALDRLSIADTERRWKERIEKPWGEGHIFVAEQENCIVGFVACGGSEDEDVERGKVGEVYAIYVHPEAWGQGHGSALLQEAIAQLRRDGFETIILWVLKGNQQAIGFYKRMDFEADGGNKVKQGRDGFDMPLVRYRWRMG